MSSVRPLFLVSLPRSGSTVVQRVLAHLPQISTASETWLLMPFLASTPQTPARPRGTWDDMATDAIGDFIRELHDAAELLSRGPIHDFAIDLYSQAAEEPPSYFLDKTPPYAHFLPELTRTFPEARFIALLSNPLAVVASVVETFSDGSWEPDRYPLSLYAALEALVFLDPDPPRPGPLGPLRGPRLGDPASWGGVMDFLGARVRSGLARRLRPGRLERPARRQARHPLPAAQRGAAGQVEADDRQPRCAGRGAAATSIGSVPIASRSWATTTSSSRPNWHRPRLGWRAWPETRFALRAPR